MIDGAFAEDYGAQYGATDDFADQLRIPGNPERLNQIRFPGHIATSQTRTVRERDSLYGGLSLGEPRRLGRLGVRPGMTMQGIYTDNVFQSPNGSRSDWQALARPGVLIDIPGFLGTDVGRKNRLAIGAHAYLLKSLEHSREFDTKQWGVFMDGGFNVVDFDTGGSPWKLVLTDAFDMGAVPPTSAGDNWRKYYGNTFSAILGYHLADKWSVEAGYTNLWRQYRQREADADDHSEDAFSGHLHYKIAPKTTVFVGGTLSLADRDHIHAKDSKNYTGEVGIRWNATQKLNGEIAATYHEKQTSRDQYRTRNGVLITNVDDEEAFGYRANVAWKPVSNWTFVLAGSRNIQETWVVDGDDLSGPHYNMTNVSLTAEWQFRPRWALTGQAGFTYSDYNGKDHSPAGANAQGVPVRSRDDEFITTALGLRCQAHSRVSVALEVRHDENKSNFDGFDYDRNTVTLTAMCAF